MIVRNFIPVMEQVGVHMQDLVKITVVAQPLVRINYISVIAMHHAFHLEIAAMISLNIAVMMEAITTHRIQMI